MGSRLGLVYLNLTSYSLAPYCEILQLGDAVHLAFGSIGMVFRTEHEKELLFSVLRHVSDPDAFRSFLSANSGNQDVLALVQAMVENHILVPTHHIPDFNRHHREQLFFLLSGGVPSDVSDRLSRKTVVLIGCGGIGCLAAYTLVTAGVRHLTLMDDDRVEIHNISRQFAYVEADVGKKKVHLLKEQLSVRNDKAEIVALDERAHFCNLDTNVPAADFIILAADEPGVIQRANKTLVRRRVPFLHICYINDIAAWGPLVVPGKTGCYACQSHIGLPDSPSHPDRTEIMRNINRHYTCPVISSVSNVAVALATLDIIRYLGEFARPASLNKRIGLWTHDLHFEYQDFSRSNSCEVCGELLT